MFLQWTFVLFALCIAAALGYTLVRRLQAAGIALPVKVLAPLLLVVAPLGWGVWSAEVQFGSLFERSAAPSPGYILAGALFFFGAAFILLVWAILFRSVRK